MDGSYVSIAERDTYLRFLKFGQREDKRGAFDFRDWRIVYGKDSGTCVTYLGNTTVLCSVKVVPKRTNKPNQNRGISKIDLSISGMSFSKFQPSRQSLRTLRKQLRQHIKSSIFWSKCVDDEALCISRGRAVFQVCVSVEIIHADGNLFDATCLGVVASLLTTQRPEISVEGDKIIALSTYEKAPIPLQINHIPVSTTFGFQSASHFMIMDPAGKEETVLNGSLTVVVNQNAEVCGFYKKGIAALPAETIHRCTEIAAMRAKDVAVRLRELAEGDGCKRSKGFSNDFIENMRQNVPTRMDVDGDSSISAKAAQLGLLTPVTVRLIEKESILLPKRENVRFLPEEEEDRISDEEDEDMGESENEDSEEETTMLNSEDF